MADITVNQFRLDNYTIDVTMTSSDFATQSVEILQLGELKYLNDVPDSSESDSSSIASIQGDWEMTFYDICDSGDSFKDELLALTSEAFVTILLTDLSSNEYKFFRNIEPYGFEYDELADETKVIFRPLSGKFYANNSANPSVDDIVNPSGSAGTDTDANVDGAGQTGFTITVDDGIGGAPARMPAVGEVVYFGNDYTGLPYKVASTTATTITFENEVLSAPADGELLLCRRYEFIVDSNPGGSTTLVDACNGLQFIKWALEDIPLQIPNFSYEAYAQDLIIEHFRRSTSDATDLYREFDLSDTTNPDCYVLKSGTAGTGYSIFAKMAALSGYFWGQGFSEQWFVSRISTANTVTLSADDVENIIQVIERPKFTDVKATVQPGGGGFQYIGLSTSTNTELTPDGKTLEYTAVFPDQLCTGLYDGTDTGTPPLQYNVDNDNNTGMEEFLTDNGADAYYAANAHEGNNKRIDVNTYDNGQKIKFTAIGILDIKPYNTIEFDTSVETIFQSKTYRISQIIYNFEEFTADVEAYRIA